MAENEGMGESGAGKEEEKIPLGQIIFDNFFFFFLLSLVLSFVFYNLWGMLELLRTPLSP